MIHASNAMLDALQPQGAPAHEQGASAPEDRSTKFVAVEGGGERFSGETLVVEAYAAIWVVLMIWIFMLWRKQAAMTVRLDGLERTLDRAAERLEAEKKAKAKAS